MSSVEAGLQAMINNFRNETPAQLATTVEFRVTGTKISEDPRTIAENERVIANATIDAFLLNANAKSPDPDAIRRIKASLKGK